VKAALAALCAGLLFALGLGLAGMTNPAKVQNFLDFTGSWDASLAFVMVGAIAVYALAWRVVRQRARPLFEPVFQPPPATVIDAKLVGGAALFGVGWGLSGFCPGPAIVSLGSGSTGPLVFVGGMVVGMLLKRVTMPAMARSVRA